jgi:hypothetical protein
VVQLSSSITPVSTESRFAADLEIALFRPNLRDSPRAALPCVPHWTHSTLPRLQETVAKSIQWRAELISSCIRGGNFTLVRAEPILEFIVPLSSTRRALIAVAIILCLACAAVGVYFYRHRGPLPSASSGQAPNLLSLLPADAPVVAYADVGALRGLKSSPLAAALGLTLPGPQQDIGYTDFVRDTGFDYTRDLDRVAVVVWPNNLGTLGERPPSGRSLAIADGRFDQQKIAAYALRSGWEQKDKLHSVYEFSGPPPQQSLFLEFLSADRVALTNDFALLHNLSNAAAHASGTRDPAMQARIERVAGAPIFAVARTDNLPPGFYSAFASSPQLEHLARSIVSLTLAGKPSGDDLKVALDGECDSMKNAIGISALLEISRMGATMALSDPKTRRQMTKEQSAFLTALVDQLKVSHQDKWVRLTLDITPAMLGASPPNRTVPKTPR